MKIDMTPEEILLDLYKQRAELEKKAYKKYASDVGVPHPPELEEMNRQISKLIQQYPYLSKTTFKSVEEGIFTEVKIPILTNVDLDKQDELWRIEEKREREARKQHRERLKHDRILKAIEDKRVHALKIIREHMEPFYHNSRSVSVDYYNFNYEDRMDAKILFDKFLETAQSQGCFESFASEGYVNGRTYSFHEVNIDNIKKFKEMLINQGYPADSKLDFDDSTSILYFQNKEVKIAKRSENDAHELLKTLFKDKNRIRNVWNTDEILDDWNFDIEKKTSHKKVYHAGKAVNRIIAQSTTIQDFLVVTTKKIYVNRKYLLN